MSTVTKLPEVVPWSKQKCPLCGEDKILIALGIMFNKDKNIEYFPDRGYSFCNCKSIWFTDWSNIDLRYVHPNDSAEVLRHYILKEKIRNNGYKKNNFLCVGEDTVKEEAERLGYETEKSKEYDIIWDYHTIEHLIDPISRLKVHYENLKENGILFVAMPDPYFIQFDNAYAWKHWLLRQHYIMWDMDSFCDELEKVGFKILLKERNTVVKLQKDYHIICQK